LGKRYGRGLRQEGRGEGIKRISIGNQRKERDEWEEEDAAHEGGAKKTKGEKTIICVYMYN
jgi:hypothetical protein